MKNKPLKSHRIEELKMSSKFYEGFNEMANTLIRIEMDHGLKEAKAAAKAALAKYICMECKTLSEYGALCGATDWLAEAEGIRENEEAIVF
jgi:hypothetical protein